MLGCGAQSYRRRVAQRPSTLTPEAGPLHDFGAALRQSRVAAGLSLARLADRLDYPTHTLPGGGRRNVSPDLIAKLEKAQRWPNLDLVKQIDNALGARGTLTRAALYALRHPDASLAPPPRP